MSPFCMSLIFMSLNTESVSVAISPIVERVHCIGKYISQPRSFTRRFEPRGHSQHCRCDSREPARYQLQRSTTASKELGIVNINSICAVESGKHGDEAIRWGPVRLPRRVRLGWLGAESDPVVNNIQKKAMT